MIYYYCILYNCRCILDPIPDHCVNSWYPHVLLGSLYWTVSKYRRPGGMETLSYIQR